MIRLQGAQGLDVRNLEVRHGELVGLAGLNGAGRSSLLKGLFGASQVESDVRLFGEPYTVHNPRQAIRRGVGLVPESRKAQGLLLDAAIYRNASLVHTRRFFPRAGQAAQRARAQAPAH